jgi:hypothetical protein
MTHIRIGSLVVIDGQTCQINTDVQRTREGQYFVQYRTAVGSPTHHVYLDDAEYEALAATIIHSFGKVQVAQ